MYNDGWFLALILMVAAPVAVLAFAWFVAPVAWPPEDAAARIARERFARGEIDKEQLGVLLQAL